SWRTSKPVIEDLKQRLPGTLELVLLSALLSVLVGVPIGVWSALRGGGVANRVLFVYGMLAGSIPDFWLGLIFVFVFFSLFGWLPGPIGQLDPVVETPPTLTGMVVVDALVAGNWEAFQ